MMSLSELTAEYYRLRADAERALALCAICSEQQEERWALVAELEALQSEAASDGQPSAILDN